MRAHRGKRASLWIALAVALGAGRLHANDLVQASLLAEPAAITPGVPFTAAVRLRVPPDWHLSWRNPGDAGLPPAIAWQLPAQISAGPVQWPAPHAITTGPVTIYALEGEVWLLSELVPARGLPADSATVMLAANVEWLVCKDLCIPEKARVQLSLPLSENPAPGLGPEVAQFAAARARLPRTLGFSAQLGKQDLVGGTAELSIATAGLELARLDGSTAQFFPYATDAINPGAAQLLHPRWGGFSLTLARPEHASAELTELSGVLVLQGREARDQVVAEISTGTPEATRLSSLPLWLALICAFAGGLILNLMPCVLPVLGFKVLSLIRDAGAGQRRARIGGLAYSAGVVASFWVLAGVLLAMRASGSALGWGFQMQSPAVVSLLALLFFVCAFAFLGFFEIGLALQTQAGAVRFSSSALGAFGSGVLATAVATPCTAPFMTVALGAALVSPPLESFLIFTALGVGMAWPYALLSLWPALLRRIPKPGPWMVRLQQGLAFPLFATVLWLLSVLSAEAGPRRVTATLTAMLVVGLALFIWRAFGGPAAPGIQRLSAGLAALVLALAGAIAAASPTTFVGAQANDAPPQTGNLLVAHHDAANAPDADAEVAWQDWSPEKFAQLRAEKRWVFVDFTAAWCLTCQVNERLIFSSRAVRERFTSLGVVPLRADWTRADPAITRALESFGRSGVPLNVIAGPNGRAPVVLPAVLTPGMVLDALSFVSAEH
jgi:thiol:disulfide interchange protein/DsbC/DsbD-like thiol-disulfide interchange protein